MFAPQNILIIILTLLSSISFSQGVGVNTSSPDQMLDIEDNSGSPQIRLTHTSTTQYVDLQATGTGELYINPSGSNVGIGTDDPANELHVYDAAGGANIKVEAQGAGVILHATNSTVDDRITQLFTTSSDQFRIRGLTDALVNDEDGITLNLSDGFVGINTTAPTQQLHVYNSGSPSIYSDGENSAGVVLRDRGATNDEEIFQFDNNNSVLKLRSLSNALVETHIGLTFSSNTGNVAVGADPTPFDLKVGGDGDMEIDDDNGANSNLVFKYSGTEVGRIIGVSSGYLTLGSNSSTPHMIIASSGNTSIGNSDATPDATLEIVETGTTPFMISNGATGDGDFMIMTTAGLVGIGTASPDATGLLHLYGDTKRLVLETATTNDAARFPIQWKNNSSAVFSGEDGSDQTYGFFAEFNGTRAEDAKIRVYGDETGGFTKYLQLTHNGTDGVISTVSGDIYLNSNTGFIGIENTNPLTAMDITGAIATRPTAVSMTSDNQAIAASGTSSYLEVISNTSSSSTRTMVLANGSQDGQILYIVNVDTDVNDAFELLNSGNVALTATMSFTEQHDNITLIWNGSSWVEVARVDGF